MPNNAEGGVGQRWIDYRVVIFIWPLSALFVVAVTIWFATLPYQFYFTEREAGGDPARKAFLAGLSIFFFLGGLYACVGLYQMFFIELREKFIARKVVYRDSEFSLRGWYFKHDSFGEKEVNSVEEYRIVPLNKRFFSKNIATMFTCLRANYKILLKDGRVFYLPGDMDRVDELKSLLEQYAKEHASA